MFLRNVVQRWRGGPVDATAVGREGADACGAPFSLLAELAVDAEDFAELARVLHRDLPTVVRAIVTAHPPTIATLVAALEADAAAGPEAPTTPAASPSIAGAEAGGWGRWTRAHGGARVHRGTPVTTSRAALAAS